MAHAYKPQDPTAATLVFETARGQWRVQRNQKRLDESESCLPPDAMYWTGDHHQQYSNFLRYKTTAGHSFYRAFNTLEAYCKRQSDKAAQAEKARAEMAKIQLQWLQQAALAAKQQLCARQYVEVASNAAGECITTFAPTNQEISEHLAAHTAPTADPRPRFVTRVISFLNGVPPAYDWLNPNENQRCQSVMGLEQFTESGWLRQIEAEQRTPEGHLLPYQTALLAD